MRKGILARVFHEKIERSTADLGVWREAEVAKLI